MFAFFLAALVVAAVPGPDNLFVLAQSATFGSRAGWRVILGLCTGICIQVSLIVAGISVIIVNSPIAFFVLQCLGAAYLLYLAFQSFRVRADAVHLSKAQDLSPKKQYLRGVIMNLTNPKAVIFLLAFLPPAVNLKSPVPPALQMVGLGGLFILSVLIVFGAVAFAAGALNKFLAGSPKANRNLNWASGVIFVLLAITLFVAT
jgi:threonine/homoserine/homoserine lactone efflux protein